MWWSRVKGRREDDSLDHGHSQSRTASSSKLVPVRQPVMDPHSSHSHDRSNAQSASEGRHAPRHRVPHDAAEGRQARQLGVSYGPLLRLHVMLRVQRSRTSSARD